MESDTIDERYTEGIWHDDYNGDFAKIRQNKETGLVELVEPENDSVYWDMPLREWKSYERYDFTKVNEEAVFDPVETVNEAMRKIIRNDPEELAELSREEVVAIKWARQQVTVSAE